MLSLLSTYKQQKNAGNKKQLEEYDGYVKPYNELFWVMAHTGIPFNLEYHGVHHGSGRATDFVLQHPLVEAGDETPDQYKCTCSNSPSLPK